MIRQTQTFVGHVVFTEQTPSGALEIKADRVEQAHRAVRRRVERRDAMMEGGCLCGAVRYRLEGVPLVVRHLSLRSCRRASGAPVVAWITVQRSQFTILSGIPAIFRSSPGVTRRFCSHCGTGLTYENESHPDTIDITSASLDDPERLPADRGGLARGQARLAADEPAHREVRRVLFSLKPGIETASADSSATR